MIRKMMTNRMDEMTLIVLCVLRVSVVSLC